MESPQEIVKRLRAAGWSQQAIADACEVSQSTICRLESGETSRNQYELVDKLRTLGDVHMTLSPEFQHE